MRDFLRVLPSGRKLRKLASLLTIYGFWIGVALGIVGILLVFDISRTVMVDKPQEEKPVISDIGVEIIWERDYEPPEKTNGALEKLLTGEVYEQPVWLDEYHEFRFPKSFDDFPTRPRPAPSGALMYVRWRIGAVPPLSFNETPTERRLPLTGEAWEWNIDPRVLDHIRISEGWNSTEAAYYKIAIAMIGGYSTLYGPDPSPETRIATIDAFKGVEWSLQAKYKVWNSGNVPTKVANITVPCGTTNILAPEGVNADSFVIRPGASNALEFTLVPEARYTTQEDAHNAADCLREKTRLNVPVSEGERVVKGSAKVWIGGAVGFGIIAATVMLKVCRRCERRQQSSPSGGRATD